MQQTINRVKSWLGEGWEFYWGLPPSGVYLLKEEYMVDPRTLDVKCGGGDGLVIVYVVASFGSVNVVYGKVKPFITRCPTATFTRSFKRDMIKSAVKLLIEFATTADGVSIFQINPEVVRFAGLCEEYPLVCDEPAAVVKKLEERIARVPGPKRAVGSTGWALGELVRVLNDVVSRDPTFIEVIKKVAEDPERLRACYV